jgi:hypothetical protein
MNFTTVRTDQLVSCPGCGSAMRFRRSSERLEFGETIVFECRACSLFGSVETLLQKFSSESNPTQQRFG